MKFFLHRIVFVFIFQMPASDLLRADIQEHVKVLKKWLSFTCVRIWNLFSEQMLVQKVAGTGKYYFRKIDLVLDFLVENQLEFWPKYAPLPDFFSVKLYGYIKGEDEICKI